MPKCKARVVEPGGWHDYQCTRDAGESGYCWQHDPERVKERRKAAEARADEQWSVARQEIAARSAIQAYATRHRLTFQDACDRIRKTL